MQDIHNRLYLRDERYRVCLYIEHERDRVKLFESDSDDSTISDSTN